MRDFRLFVGDFGGDPTTGREVTPLGTPFNPDIFEMLPIVIDIRPRSSENRVRPGSPRLIPVAILTTEAFDAAALDASTVRFGRNATEAAPVGAPILRDVNGDGTIDMLLRFRIRDTAIVCGDTSAFLTGMTVRGEAVMGLDNITTVGCR
ncbi:MAG: hypothetical protein ACT4PY_03170 [Armatimonadota bacterium]